MTHPGQTPFNYLSEITCSYNLENPDPEKWSVGRRIDQVEHLPEHLGVGNEDGTAEWNDQRIPNSDLFLKSQNYSKFREERTIYLIGRRGTGKSCFMNMLKHEIRSDSDGLYSYCWLIDDRQQFGDGLDIGSEFFERFDDESIIKNLSGRLWRWIIKVSAMRSFYLVNSGSVSSEERECSEIIFEMLRDYSLLDEDGNNTRLSCIRYLRDKIVDVVLGSPGLIESIGSSMLYNNIVDDLIRAPNFAKAFSKFTRYLSKNSKRALVLIDSVEEYSLTDSRARSICQGLLAAVDRTNDFSVNHRIYVKIAFPSELTPYMTFLNSGKKPGNRVTIVWGTKLFTDFIASRLAFWNACENSDSTKKHRHSDLQSSAPSDFLPEFITSYQGVRQSTINYIVKHSQQRPRQVITLLNSILHSRGLIGNTDSITADDVKAGVHSISSSLFVDCVENYTKIYNQAERVVTEILSREKNLMSYADLEMMLRKAKQLGLDLGRTDLVNLLVQSGLVGRVVRGGKDARGFWALADFQYQVKQYADFKPHDILAIHPMVYDALNISVSRDIIVHPSSDTDRSAAEFSHFDEFH